ncbi:MAG TPA: immune inhibitor A domain-containing protein [Candidatus Limnocylindria bacterium]|nr:immune inhibitor A domain-containing protein [Candidatus Limnocylindria bacterium]
MTIGFAAPSVAAIPVADRAPGAAMRADNRPGPFTARQDARREAAQRLILSGQASPNADGVVQLADDKYFEAAVTGTGRLFTILSEFGEQGSGRFGTVPGPLHNEIPKPNREIVNGVDNSDYNADLPYDNFRLWRPDFNRAYYEDKFFGPSDSMADFYTKQSSGNYTLAGGVSDWVQVPGNASTYGDNAIEDFGGAWQFIEDSGNAWYQAQKNAGMSDADIKAYLATFDVWDRNDYDNDGNFDEPDGYIDHFQAVHAGEGEDAGGGAQGGDAIWSHRWYVNPTDFGLTGPTVNGTDVLFGGSQIGNTGFWIGDYTVEGENGGLGVFAHEYAHDLGLPDFYDTNAGENGTAFWTLMSSGSWIGDGTEDIGNRPDYMGPWEKLQLGWLDYEVVSGGESGDFVLSPAARQVADQAQAVIVDVPDQAVVNDYTTPAGGHAWWTSSADDLNTTLTNSFDLSGVSRATVTARAWYDIEAGYDYLFAEYSTDAGATWTQTGSPLDGSSNGRWKTLRYAVPGGSADTLFRFRFFSDGGVHLANAFLDDFVVRSGGTTIFTDDVEDGEDGWTAEGGFKISDGSEETVGDRYYIAENRNYVDYDAGLETGPYQFSFALTDPDKVEHFAFQDGLLVWMIDETYSDNNNSEHPGHGLALPIDARPAPFSYSDGTRPSNRRQPFDATFGLQAVPAGPTLDPETGDELPCAGLHKQVVVGKGPNQSIEYLCAWPTSLAAIPQFTDSSPTAYWDASNPQNSTMTADSDVTILVTTQNAGGTMTIHVTNPTAP